MLFALLFAVLLSSVVFNTLGYDRWLNRSRFANRVFETDRTVVYIILMGIVIFGMWLTCFLMWLNLWYERKQDFELEPIA
jgi:hypothetical protein